MAATAPGPDPFIARVRRFNRTVTERVGALNDRYLARDRPLGASRVLWEVGDDGTDVRALRARLGLDSGYVSRLLRGLEADGLVTVEPNEHDRRVRTARLTAEGRAERALLDRSSDELARLTGRALAGNLAKVGDKLAAQNKLFVRDRLDLLLDAGSFVEDGLLANSAADDLPADCRAPALTRAQRERRAHMTKRDRAPRPICALLHRAARPVALPLLRRHIPPGRRRNSTKPRDRPPPIAAASTCRSPKSSTPAWA